MNYEELFNCFVADIIVNADTRTQELKDGKWTNVSYRYEYRHGIYLVNVSVECNFYPFVRIRVRGVSGADVDSRFYFFFHGTSLEEFMEEDDEALEPIFKTLDELAEGLE